MGERGQHADAVALDALAAKDRRRARLLAIAATAPAWAGVWLITIPVAIFIDAAILWFLRRSAQQADTDADNALGFAIILDVSLTLSAVFSHVGPVRALGPLATVVLLVLARRYAGRAAVARRLAWGQREAAKQERTRHLLLERHDVAELARRERERLDLTDSKRLDPADDT